MSDVSIGTRLNSAAGSNLGWGCTIALDETTVNLNAPELFDSLYATIC